MILALLNGCFGKEKVQYGKDIKLPNSMYCINFSTIKLIDIISILQKNNVNFKTYNWDSQEIKWRGTQDQIERLLLIETNEFIGCDLDKSKIIKVVYRIMPPYMAFQVCVTMKIEYYDKLLESLNKQFGNNNAYINTRRYNEISWDANNKTATQDDVLFVILSKQQGNYETSEKAQKRKLCYLTIQTKGLDMEAEYRKFVEKEKQKSETGSVK